MNQAIFERILVQVDDVDGQPKPLYAELTQLAEKSTARRDADDRRTKRKGRRGEHDESPRSLRGLGSNIDQLVRDRGQRSNHEDPLGGLISLLLDPTDRQLRRRAAEAARASWTSGGARTGL